MATASNLINDAEIDRAYIMRKFMCKCPVCGKAIHGRDLFDHPSHLPTRPTSITFCHGHQYGSDKPPLHAIHIFLDANMGVRSVEKSDLLRIIPDA